MMEKIRLIVACEYTLYREAISKVLAPEGDIEIVAEASDMIEVKRAIRQTEADLLLLDIDIAKLNTIEVLSLIKKERPNLGVLLFIMRDYDEKIANAICTGEMGYIPKSADTGELIKSIKASLH